MRTGKFYITGKCVHSDQNEIGQVLAFMGFIPTRVEFLHYRDQFEMIGISPMFEDISIGKQIPEYTIITHVDGGKVTSVKAEKNDPNEIPSKLAI